MEEPRQAKPSHPAAQVEAAAAGVGGPTLDAMVRQVFCARFITYMYAMLVFCMYPMLALGFADLRGKNIPRKLPSF